MPLIPETDQEYLDSKQFNYELSQYGPEIHLILKQWGFPPAYNPREGDVLIRILPGYPMTPLDMFWTYPDIRLANGSWPAASEVHENLGGRNWQRWSRHTAWRPGIDDLRSFLTSVIAEINKGI